MKSFEVEVEKVEKVIKNGKEEELKVVNKVPIVPVAIKKGKGQGGEYLAPKELSTMTIDDLFKIFSKDEIWTKLLKPKLKQFCATITTEASIDGGRITASMVKQAFKKKKKVIEEQPIQDEEKFYSSWAKYFSSLSSVGESLAGLTRQQNELLMELLGLNSKSKDYGTRSVQLLDEIRKVREAIDDKKADDAEDTGTEENEEEKQAVAA